MPTLESYPASAAVDVVDEQIDAPGVDEPAHQATAVVVHGAAHPCGREVAAADLGDTGTRELVGGHHRSGARLVRPVGGREGVEPHLDEAPFEIDIAMPAVRLREQLDRAHRLAPLEQLGCLPQGRRRIGHISVAETHHATGAFIARDRQQKIHFS